MKRRNPYIARALFWDALILLFLSGYELFVRLDASWGWAKGYFASHMEAKTPVGIVLRHIPYQNVGVWFYMLGCALLALWALCSRRTRRASAWMLVPCAALTAAGFTLRLTLFGDLLRTLKLLPLVLMLLLCLLHVLIPLPKPQQPGRPAFPPQRPAHAAFPAQPRYAAPQPLQPYARRRRSDRRKAS